MSACKHHDKHNTALSSLVASLCLALYRTCVDTIRTAAVGDVCSELSVKFQIRNTRRRVIVCHVLQTLLDRSHSLQTYISNSSPSCQAAEFQKLQHQHAQLLEFNQVLVEENNQRLVDHAELMSEVSATLCTAESKCTAG